jgi:hypothetical protein
MCYIITIAICIVICISTYHIIKSNSTRETVKTVVVLKNDKINLIGDAIIGDEISIVERSKIVWGKVVYSKYELARYIDWDDCDDDII